MGLTMRQQWYSISSGSEWGCMPPSSHQTGRSILRLHLEQLHGVSAKGVLLGIWWVDSAWLSCHQLLNTRQLCTVNCTPGNSKQVTWDYTLNPEQRNSKECRRKPSRQQAARWKQLRVSLKGKLNHSSQQLTGQQKGHTRVLITECMKDHLDMPPASETPTMKHHLHTSSHM